MIWTARIALAATIGLALAACNTQAVPQGERIVTVGGSITEIVFALGAGDRVVGVDKTSVYPDAVAKLPQVGTPGQLSAEAIAALGPSLVLADGRAPAPALEQLQALGLKVERVADDPRDAAQAAARIRRVAKLLGREAAGEDLAARVERESAAAITALPTKKPRALFVYARGAKTLMVAGRDTAADAMLALAGAENGAAELSGFQPMTAESVLLAKPEVIVIPTRGLDSVGGIEGLLGLPGIAQTPAGAARRIVSVDDLELLGFGPRLGHGLAKLVAGLHPERSGGAPGPNPERSEAERGPSK